MRKLLVGLLLLVGIVLAPFVVLSASKPSLFSLISGANNSTASAIVTPLPKGALVFKEPSKAVIPPGTVSASQSSTLQGIVTPLEKPPVQDHGSTSEAEETQGTTDPVLMWEIYNRGSYFGSFQGATKTNKIVSKYLFSSSRTYDLKVDMYVTGKNSTTTQYQVKLFDHMASEGFVYSNVLTVGKSVTVTYPNLNPTHLYYVSWSPKSNDQSIDGNFYVHF